MPHDLVLGTRSGLPDAMAYLRGAHPQAQWRTHANFGELAAFWLQVHDGLRREGREVATTIDAFREGGVSADGFQRAFVPRLNAFLAHLDQHHRIEDAAYFPKFRALDGRMVVGFDLLEADHAIIHEKLVATVAGARTLLAALASTGAAARDAADVYASATEDLLAILVRHLADEEDLVIPALLRHGERPLL